jgi:YVTN family beta-propeller protein
MNSRLLRWAQRNQRSKYATLALLSTIGIATAISSVTWLPAATTLAIPIDQTQSDPLTQGLNIPANAATAGMWSATQPWPLNGIHAVVMPDGKVLTYGTPLNNPGAQDGRTYDYWTPNLGFGANSHQTTTDNNRPNSFCSTAAFLADGRLMLSGGNSPVNSALISWQTGAWQRDISNMAQQRWYGTAVTMPDGRVTMVGGMAPYTEGQMYDPAAAIAAGQASMTPEIYTPGTGWRTLLGATSRDAFGPDFLRDSYPRAFVAPDGRVFGVSADNMWYLDVNGNNGAGVTSIAGRFKTPSASAPVNAGASNSAVMFAPGRILIAGGNGSINGEAFPASNMASVIDINGGFPVVSETARMTFPRRYINTVVLPNGKVVATGGTRFANNGGADAVYAAEIWDPATNAWTLGNSAAQIRNYHSSTLLLPNGTVLSVGGGAPGPVNNQNAEIYYPPYLFQGNQLAPRPQIVGVNALNFAYNASLQIQMSNANAVSGIAIVRNGSMTHSFNGGQRFQRLNFTQAGDILTATLPANGNIAPPGTYQAYVLNANGVPSRSVIISIGQTGGIAPPVNPYPALGPEWIQAGNTARRIAVSADNTIAIVNSADGSVWRKTGDDTAQNWAQIPGRTLTSIALVNNTSIWGTGTDGNVWRYAAGVWTQLGNTALDLAASSDGTIVVINSAANTVWRKRGDDNIENWTGLSGLLKRVALVNGNTIWGISMDDGIWRYDGANWTRIGTGVARAIAASANGTIVYLDRDSGQLFRKIGDDGLNNFVAVPGRMPEIAVAQSGALWAISGTGTIHRLAPTAALPVINPITAPPLAAGATANYNPGLDATGLTFSWNFGDGSPATPFVATSAISRVFPAPGQYLVTLTVRNSSGQTTTKIFTQAIFAAPTATAPRASSQLVLEPRTGASTRIWTVNPDNQSVSVFDTANNARTNEITVGNGPRTIARANDGTLWVVNKDSASISVISASTMAVTRTIALPAASQPYGIVIAPNGQVFVSLQASGTVLKLDGTTGATLATLNVGPNPRHLSVSGDSNRLLVSRFITPALPGESTAVVNTPAGTGGEVLVVNAVNMTLTATVKLQHSDKTDTEIQGAGIPNYLGAPLISPDGTSAWTPSKQDNVKRGTRRNGQNLDFQNTVRAISSRIDLSTLTEVYASRIDHDNASLASAAAFDPTGSYLFVALETSRQVAVVNPRTGAQLFRIAVGLAPQGLAVSADGLSLYVHNFMGRTLSVVDLAPLTRNGEFRSNPVATVPTVAADRLAANVLRGKQLFYDAADTRLARDSYMSCASCHNDAGHDGRVWDLSGFGEGLRNSVSLQGRAGRGHGFLHWSANFDEVQDFEAQIRSLAGGTGLMPDALFNTGTRNQPLGDPKAGVSADLDALAAYLGSLNTMPNSPFRNADGSLTAAAVAGRSVFTAQNCASCHGGANFTLSDGAAQLRSIGTLKPTSGTRLNGPLTGIDIPTLRDVFETGPYLHDGSAATLADAVTAHAGTTIAAADMANLVEYIRQIGGAEPGFVSGPTVTVTSPANGTSFTAGAAIPLSASATVGTGRTIANVTFLDGSVAIATVNAAPYTFNWTNAATGPHSITARVTDSTGAVATSPAVTIAVNAVVIAPPTVSITSPAAGSSFVLGAPITVSANAAAFGGRTIASVMFVDGATVLRTITAAPYTFTWTNAALGGRSIVARVTDSAGVVTSSAAVAISITAAPPPATIPTGANGLWTFDGISGAIATDTSGSGRNLNLQGTYVTTGAGISGQSVKLNGVFPSSAQTARPVLNTATSFSVSTWVRFDSLPNCLAQTVASQDGAVVSAFYLGVFPICNNQPLRFDFTMMGSDRDSAPAYRPLSTTVPQVGVWYHLAGVRDSASGAVKLYVNGRLEAQVSNPSNWNATGAFVVGRAKFSGGWRNGVNGSIDKTVTYQRALTDAEVQALFTAK